MRARTPYLAHLPLVCIATITVLALPVLILTVAQLALSLKFGSIVTALLASVLSIAVGWAGSRLWLRNPRSKDVLFSDLMLWGWVQRVIQERRLQNAARALRFDSGRPRTPLAGKEAEKQIATLKKLAYRLEAQDLYTHGHTRRVARHSYMIAKAMGLSLDFAKKVRTAAAVHDVGKMDIPIEVLHKPGKLTDDEFDLIKQHSVIGADMVAEAGIDELTAMVRHHHERLDGRGYPDRLAGDDIPLGARIIAVADTFDAITSVRSYRDASAHKKAIDILKKEAGTQLDGDATAAFIRYYNASRSRRFAAMIFSAPDGFFGWLSALFRQAATATAMTSAAAASVAVMVTPAIVSPPPQDLELAGHRVVAVVDDAKKTDASDDGSTSPTGDGTQQDDDGQKRNPEDGTNDKGGSGKSGSDDSGSGSDDSGSGSDDSGSGSDDSGSGSDSDNSGSGSDDSGSGSDDSGSGSDNSGSGSDSDNSGSGSDSDNSGSGSDNSGSGSDNSGSGSDDDDDGGGLVDDVVDTVDDVLDGVGL